jgi:hypothetical protein
VQADEQQCRRRRRDCWCWCKAAARPAADRTSCGRVRRCFSLAGDHSPRLRIRVRAPGWRRVRPNFVLPRLPHCTTTSGAGDGGRVIATAALRRPAADAGCTKGVVRRHDDQRDGAAASHHNQACRRRPPKCTLRDGNAQGRPRASTAYASVGAAAPVVPTADGQARHSRHA